MPFLHPIVFWTGLAAVSVPILIHLLNRRRFRMLDWAAMQFLWESVRRNRRRLRIEEMVLLALRCLVLLALAMALARFTGCRAMEALPVGTESQTAVFLIDDSYSMGQRVGGGTILSAATPDIAERIEKLTQTDKVAILLTSGAEDAEAFFKLTHVADAEVEQLSARLAGLSPSDGRARLDRALAAAGKAFQGEKSAIRRLYLYSDFRQVDLASAGESDGIRSEFAKRSIRRRKLDSRQSSCPLAVDSTWRIATPSFCNNGRPSPRSPRPAASNWARTHCSHHATSVPSI